MLSKITNYWDTLTGEVQKQSLLLAQGDVEEEGTFDGHSSFQMAVWRYLFAGYKWQEMIDEQVLS